LEPQRTDLFLVDLSSAAKLMAQVAPDTAVSIFVPQYVRSVSFPEVKIRPEPFRRNSIPYNMPTWDEPVGEFKITFLTDTWDSINRCDVCNLLDLWVALSRAGRGARTNQYYTNGGIGWFLLDATYKVSSRFDINVSLVRGAIPAATTPTQSVQQAQAIVNLNANQIGAATMVEHTKWIARNAWCAGYKLGDLNYSENQLMTIEASFFPETIERDDSGSSVNVENEISDSPVPLTGASVKSNSPSASSTSQFVA
jgi:hypothetical protein